MCVCVGRVLGGLAGDGGTFQSAASSMGQGQLSHTHTTRANQSQLSGADQVRGEASSLECGVVSDMATQHSTQTATWPQVTAQNKNVQMAFGSNMSLRHEHRP